MGQAIETGFEFCGSTISSETNISKLQFNPE